MATSLTVTIIPNDKGNPPGKLADAELHFTDGPLAGLKLAGFAIWERRTRDGRNVTFPARQYSVNGERRTFALLRPITGEGHAHDVIRDTILDAYASWEAENIEPHTFIEDTQDAQRVRHGDEDVAHCVTCGQAADRPIHRAVRS